MGLSITRDNYFDLEQPMKSEELFNVIEVPIAPFALATESEEVYTSDEDFTIAAGETKEMIIEFNSVPVKSPSASIVASSGNITLDTGETTYFAWGAKIVVVNVGAASGTFSLSVSGYPLQVIGEETVSAKSDASISENGKLKYELGSNHLIQDRDIAQVIADGLLASFSTPRKDATINWRGHPALELGDEVTPVIYTDDLITTTDDFTVYKQTLTFDGTLKASLEARKVA